MLAERERGIYAFKHLFFIDIIVIHVRVSEYSKRGQYPTCERQCGVERESRIVHNARPAGHFFFFAHTLILFHKQNFHRLAHPGKVCSLATTFLYSLYG